MQQLTLVTDEAEYVPVSSEPMTEEWKLRESIRDTVYGLRQGVSEDEIREHLTRNPKGKYWYEPEEVEYILKRAKEEISSSPSSESNPELTTVECPICHEVIEIPGYDSISRSEALKEHIEEKHTSYESSQGSEFHELMLHAVADMYGPGGVVLNEERAKATSCECVEYKPTKYIAVDNAFNRANYPEEIGKVYDSPPSYVAVEKIEGKYWCTSKGVVGALTDEQERIYCNPRVMVEKPALKERLTSFGEAVEYCRTQLPPTDGRTRLEIYLDCMSKELAKAGIKA